MKLVQLRDLTYKNAEYLVFIHEKSSAQVNGICVEVALIVINKWVNIDVAE